MQKQQNLGIWSFRAATKKKKKIAWGADFDVVLFECDPATPPSISTTKNGTPKRFGMVREQVWKNYLFGQKFLPDPQKPPHGQKFLPRRAFLGVKNFVDFHIKKPLEPKTG